MFEIGLSCEFDGNQESGYSKFQIKESSLFEHPDKKEFSGMFSHGSYSFLSRIPEPLCYAEKARKKLWVFGTVFTSKAYATSIGSSVQRIYAREVLQIYLEGAAELTTKVKGSFVLILWNDLTEELKVITDRHNVLPLYYSQKGKNIIISSAIPVLVKMANLEIVLDPVGFASQMIFDYPITDLHYIKGIKRFLAASEYTFSRSGLEHRKWWSVTSLHHEELMSPKDSLKALSELMYENVALYGSDAEKLLVSLTGGFDGRTNLSMLRKPKEYFLTYSYGMPGSLQIRVPQEISNKTGINYQPVYLDGLFLENYSWYSHRSTVYSNGLAPIGFANIDYAFSRLSNYSNIAMTGLFGSEILRPLSPDLGIQMNKRVFDLFFHEKGRELARNYLQQFFTSSALMDTVLGDGIEEVCDLFERNYVQKYKEFGREKSSFFFLLEEGMPKYFQQEIQIERTYVSTRSPYLDNDLIDLIYQTPFAGMYNGFLGNNKIKKRRGQLLYAHVIEKYFPELNRIRVDRLYKPIDLVRPFPLNYLLLAIGVTRKNLYLKSKGGNDTFKTENWTRSTIRNILQQHKSNPLVNLDFNPKILEGSNRNDANDITFRHMVAIIEFMNYLNDERSQTQSSPFCPEEHPGESLVHP